MQRFALLTLLVMCAVAHAAEGDDQIRCSDEGRNFAKLWKTEYEDQNTLFRDALVDNAEFHFSRTLKTCLVYVAVTEGEIEKDSPGIWHHKRVMDIYSNRALVYTRFMIDKKTKKKYYVPLKNIGDAKFVTDDDFADIKAKYLSE
jgi:hypothetical protein